MKFRPAAFILQLLNPKSDYDINNFKNWDTKEIEKL